MLNEYKECFIAIGKWIGKFLYGILILLPALVWIIHCVIMNIQEPPVLDAICMVVLNIVWALIPVWFTWGKQFDSKKEYCKEYFSSFSLGIIAVVLTFGCLFYIVLPASLYVIYLCMNGPEPPLHWYDVFIIPITLLWFPFGKWSMDRLLSLLD
jgi:hypothetical protein